MRNSNIKYPISLGFVRFQSQTGVSWNSVTVKRFWARQRPGKRVMLHAKVCYNKPIKKK